MLIRDLFTRRQIKPTGILHVGAHLGQEGPIYNQAGVPDDKIFWVEANPKIYDELVKRYGVTQCFNECVADVDGQVVDFNISSNDGQSSSILQFGTHLQQHPSVKFIDTIRVQLNRLDTIFGKFYPRPNVDFLVMDIQGAELKALQGMGSWLNDFKWVYLEVNREEVYKECGQIEEVDQLLGSFGFERVETKWVGGWGDAFWHKIKTDEKN